MRAPFDIAADLDTPVSAYLKLTPLRPRFLLESVTGGESVSRYSIIGFGDAQQVRINARHSDPLGALRAALDCAPMPGAGIPGLPLAGGLVGVAAYDLVRHFERVPDPHADRSEPDALYLAPESMLVFDHASRRCALLHAGSDTERQALRRDVVLALRGAVPRRPQQRESGFRGGGFGSPTASLSREAFESGVRQVREHILAGDVYQLVLSNAFEGACALDPFQVYRALRLLNPSPYMTFLELDGLSVVGASPEALVKLRGRRATLRPIAGTRRRGGTSAADLALERELLADPKEAAEHVMLVDLARNDLGRVATPGSIGVDPYRTIERYSHVMHIVSGVAGELRDGVDQFELFAAAFPAGTVVGAPKVRAMELVAGLEPRRRGVYAGTVGYFGRRTADDGSLEDAMDQAIAIRTLTFQDGRYRYQAGAGVVADSTPAGEYDEVLAKSEAMRAALALAEEGL